jgi:hypothetical protein
MPDDVPELKILLSKMNNEVISEYSHLHLNISALGSVNKIPIAQEFHASIKKALKDAIIL